WLTLTGPRHQGQREAFRGKGKDTVRPDGMATAGYDAVKLLDIGMVDIGNLACAAQTVANLIKHLTLVAFAIGAETSSLGQMVRDEAVYEVLHGRGLTPLAPVAGRVFARVNPFTQLPRFIAGVCRLMDGELAKR